MRRRIKEATHSVVAPVLGVGDRRIDHRIALAEQPFSNDVKGMLATFADRISSLELLVERLSDQARGQSEVIQPLADAVRMLQLRCDEFDERVAAGKEQNEIHRSLLPSLLDAVSTQHSAARELKRQEGAIWTSMASVEDRIHRLEERTERARQELLFEMRYGAQDRGVVEAAVEPKIVNPEKVEGARADLRLNLGCGAFPTDGFINVDVREIEGVVDVVADLGHLPFEQGSVAEILASHVLEHFPEEELARRLLPYWVSLLKPDGVLRAIVPDAEAMMRSWAEGRTTFDDLRLVTFGGQEYDGDFHFTMFTVDSLADRMREAGLGEVEVVAIARRNGLCYELELCASRPVPGGT